MLCIALMGLQHEQEGAENTALGGYGVEHCIINMVVD